MKEVLDEHRAEVRLGARRASRVGVDGVSGGGGGAQ